MKKRILSVVLCTAMLATLLAGCGSKAEEPAAAEPSGTEEPVSYTHMPLNTILLV